MTSEVSGNGEQKGTTLPYPEPPFKGRIERLKLFAVAQNLITQADCALLAVLVEELPSYLESRGQPTDWFDVAVGHAVPE